MAYQCEWLIENQVLYTKLWGEQSIDDLKQLNREVTALLNESHGHLVHMVTDESALDAPAVRLFELRKTLTYTTHKNLGWTIMFGGKEQGLTGLTKNYMRKTLVKLARMRFARVATFDEAIAQLLNVDSMLDWDKLNPDLQVLTAVN